MSNLTTYTILLKNKSGQDHDYFLFVAAPDVSTSPQVFTNVYITAPGVPSPRGTANFLCYASYYAVCGTSPGQQLGSNVKVTTGDFAPVSINQGTSKPGSHVVMSGAPGDAAKFDTSAAKMDCQQAGQYEIECLSDFSTGGGANQFIGLGGQDPEDSTNIVPVAVFNANPGTSNFIRPHTTYYISWGTYTPGQIIDVTTIANPAECDFTGRADPNMTVTHNPDGTWTID